MGGQLVTILAFLSLVLAGACAYLFRVCVRSGARIEELEARFGVDDD